MLNSISASTIANTDTTHTTIPRIRARTRAHSTTIVIALVLARVPVTVDSYSSDHHYYPEHHYYDYHYYYQDYFSM